MDDNNELSTLLMFFPYIYNLGSITVYHCVSLWVLTSGGVGVTVHATVDSDNGPTKHHTDRTGREIAAWKAQINYRDLVINLYTAYHAMHDEFSQKFYRKKFTDDRRMTCYRKRRNTAPSVFSKLLPVEFLWEFVVNGVIGSV